ncbi:hypothetical protein IMSAGC013_03859 [Lachnospiraceae bacterium]|nr:hypothetical protein IMSAGC013_03859 [Lachnospiraceae bacterium]
MLKLVRHQIPALGIRPHLQGILHVIKILPPHGVPERLFILIRRPAFLLFAVRIVVRLIRDRLGDRLIQLRVNRRLPFQPLNLLPQIHNLLLHLLIGSRIFRRQQAVPAPLAVQESLCRLPCLCTLLPQLQNLLHLHTSVNIFFNLNASKAPAASPTAPPEPSFPAPSAPAWTAGN